VSIQLGRLDLNIVNQNLVVDVIYNISAIYTLLCRYTLFQSVRSMLRYFKSLL